MMNIHLQYRHNVRTREATKAQNKLQQAPCTEKKQAANNETSKYGAQKVTASLMGEQEFYKN
jgi:hypothetical protein